MSAVPHLGFIVAAYAATVLVLGGTVVAMVADRRAQTRLLERFGAGSDEPGSRHP